MSNDDGTIQINDVSDTSLWVAHYRALETERADALFHDPLAKVLVGERGKSIAESMQKTSQYTAWSVILRTVVIDRYVQKLVSEGVDLVVNLGAGLDTRPYRLKLPETLKWVEVDYPHLIQYKESRIGDAKPAVKLERVSLDLADREKRRELFARLATEGKKILVLTEGVILYLSEEQVTTLAEDLKAEAHFVYWIAEYMSTQVYRYLRDPKRMKQMKNAPFRFFPADWFQFFSRLGWQEKETVYLSEESYRVNRALPYPWWVSLLKPFMSATTKRELRRQMGYVLFTRR